MSDRTEGATIGAPRDIVQSRFGTTLRFKFHFDRVHFRWRDLTGERGFTVAYNVIDVHNPGSLVFNNLQFARRLLAIPVILFGIAVASAMFSDVISGTLCALSFVIFFGICVAYWLRLFAIHFILFDLSTITSGSGGHPIRVIENEQANSIIEQLKIGWERQTSIAMSDANEPLISNNSNHVH